ncbi:MAG: hypothetical protein F6K19_08945 [Cyanothece sp. SIO1E1]|nr:hypothetical protein [Cyanothece sp. SIO1E1]
MINQHFVPELTGDGSFTFFSDEFGEWFHSQQGAYQEAQLKFIEPTHLVSKAQRSSLCLLDICYGLGYNTAAALETIQTVNPDCQVEWVGLELNPAVPRAAIAHNLLTGWSQSTQQILASLADAHQVQNNYLYAQLLIGAARQWMRQLHQHGFKADVIFLDPFSPPHCPQLWTIEFLQLVAQCLKPDGRLATYSCAAAVRTALLAAGLHIGATTAVGRRSPGTVASFTQTDLPPLSLQECEHLQTRAAIPYRDPQLQDPAEVIIQRRQQEQAASRLETTSQWKKRWRNIAKPNRPQLPTQ